MIELIIFDLDGVLAHTEPIHFGTLCHAINHVAGIPYADITKIIRIDGSTTKNKLAILRNIFNWNDDIVDRIENMKQTDVVQEFVNMQSTPEQIEMLSVLSKDYRLAIGSNARKRSVDTVVDAMQIRHFFECVIAIDDVGIPKPDPAIFNYIMQIMNVDPINTLIIEDSPRGIQAARASYANVLITSCVEETTLEYIQTAISRIP